MKLKHNRSESGVSLGFVAMCAFLLGMLIYFGFQFTMLMGGSREVRNAADAAILNVSKRCIEVKVAPNAVYKDCADTQGTVGLSNINRVWGKAMLITANNQEMKDEGLATGDSTGNAETAYALAQATNDSLVNKLGDSGTLNVYYKALTNNRHTKLFGPNSTLSTEAVAGYQTGMVDRGAESNLEFAEDQMPTGTSAKPITAGERVFMQGYTPFTVGGKTFCFTSFKLNEMPHLISDSTFSVNSAKDHPLGLMTNAVPNSFQATASTVNPSGVGLGASAASVTNPQRQYKLAMPHAYISILFTNVARWYVEGNKLKETTYGNAPESQWGVKLAKLSAGGRLNGYASLGGEYMNASILKAIDFAPGDYTQVYNKMAQRIREIKPGFSVQDLKDVMKTITVTPATNRYFIFPVYDSADCTNPTIKAQPDTGNLPEWLNPDNPPDGVEGPASPDKPGLIDDPNYCWSQIIGPPGPTDIHSAELHGRAYWKPGTGFGQCLGETRFSHVTEIKFTGKVAK